MSGSVADAERGGRPQHQLADRLVVVDLARHHLGRQHALGEVVVPGETDPRRRRQHARRPQRLGHPLGVAAVPPRALAPARLRLQMRLDLTGRRRARVR